MAQETLFITRRENHFESLGRKQDEIVLKTSLNKISLKSLICYNLGACQFDVLNNWSGKLMKEKSICSI